jgi:hypothetical protein
MWDLQQVLEEREIDVRCWQCGWTEARTMSWLSSKRHMSCPTCDSVIVLDTSQVRREIMRQRKQLAALHGQMVNLLESPNKISQRPLQTLRHANPRPVLDLALAHRHPETLALSARATSMRRSTRG